MKSWDALGPLQEGILAMGAFSRVGIGMKPMRSKGEASKWLNLDVQCELAQQKAVDGELDWQFIPNEAGRPTLVRRGKWKRSNVLVSVTRRELLVLDLCTSILEVMQAAIGMRTMTFFAGHRWSHLGGR